MDKIYLILSTPSCLNIYPTLFVARLVWRIEMCLCIQAKKFSIIPSFSLLGHPTRTAPAFFGRSSFRRRQPHVNPRQHSRLGWRRHRRRKAPQHVRHYRSATILRSASEAGQPTTTAAAAAAGLVQEAPALGQLPHVEAVALHALADAVRLVQHVLVRAVHLHPAPDPVVHDD